MEMTTKPMSDEEIVENLKTMVFGVKAFERFSAKERETLDMAIKALEQEPKTGYCKDCRWWKDSDGKYRRGCGAESICPINTGTVYLGEGYCYMFLPKAESEG